MKKTLITILLALTSVIGQAQIKAEELEPLIKKALNIEQ